MKNMKHIVKVMSIDQDKDGFRRILVVRPSTLDIFAGRALVVSINKEGLQELKNPIYFASPPDDFYIEFIFKESYMMDRFNESLCKVKPADELIIWESSGSFEYKTKGVFIVSGIGIVPCMSIFRQLRKNGTLEGNFLIYCAKSNEETLFDRELKHLFGRNCVFLVSRNSGIGYEVGRLDEDFIKAKISNLSQQFYVCGPDSFVNNTREILNGLNTLVIAETIKL